MVFASTRFSVMVSTADLLLSAVEAVTLHGVPSSWQLKVKSLAIPSPSAAEVLDFKPVAGRFNLHGCEEKAGEPGWNFVRSAFSFQMPTNGSAAANRDNVMVNRTIRLAIFMVSSNSRCETPLSGHTKFSNAS